MLDGRQARRRGWWRSLSMVWLDMKRSPIPALLGFALLLGGLGIQVWNEDKAVRRAQDLDEGLADVTRIQASKIDLVNEGKLVYVVGRLNIPEPLEDPMHKVAIRAVKLRRRVQMFQWIEVENRIEEEQQDASSHSSYSYDQDWRDRLIDSSAFQFRYGHENPIKMPLETELQVASHVYVGAFHLSQHLIQGSFGHFHPLTGDEQPTDQRIKLHAGLYFHCEDLFKPRVGDIRIQFSYAGLADPHLPSMVSVLARQEGQELVPAVTRSGNLLFSLHEGQMSLEDLISMEHLANKSSTWVLRIVGSFLILLGTSFIQRPLLLLLPHVPIMREMVSGDGLSLAFSMSAFMSLLVIGLSWMWLRPKVAAILLVSAMFPAVWSRIRDTHEPAAMRSI
ncbi:unnamed protein product [Darwinula stevensoni]|uniref:Transmembrane protein 43 n=1 Tax=Darwinula stevensoni TaxID=69355 RepID=A0A7R8X722_9CRUS|nr:unnamed protein product [Darwinula stevensoni]CAG0881874.1 unnamed protein product [Darwinula stevensoni]